MPKILTEYKTSDNREILYEVFDDGYDIYIGGNRIFTQREPAIPYRELSYEEGAIKQIEDQLVPKQVEPTVEERLSDIEVALAELYGGGRSL